MSNISDTQRPKSKKIVLLVHTKNSDLLTSIEQQAPDYCLVKGSYSLSFAHKVIQKRPKTLLLVDMETCEEDFLELTASSRHLPCGPSLVIATKRASAPNMLKYIEQGKAFRLIYQPTVKGQMRLAIDAAYKKLLKEMTKTRPLNKKNNGLNDGVSENQDKKQGETSKSKPKSNIASNSIKAFTRQGIGLKTSKLMQQSWMKQALPRPITPIAGGISIIVMAATVFFVSQMLWSKNSLIKDEPIELEKTNRDDVQYLLAHLDHAIQTDQLIPPQVNNGKDILIRLQALAPQHPQLSDLEQQYLKEVNTQFRDLLSKDKIHAAENLLHHAQGINTKASIVDTMEKNLRKLKKTKLDRMIVLASQEKYADAIQDITRLGLEHDVMFKSYYEKLLAKWNTHQQQAAQERFVANNETPPANISAPKKVIQKPKAQPKPKPRVTARPKVNQPESSLTVTTTTLPQRNNQNITAKNTTTAAHTTSPTLSPTIPPTPSGPSREALNQITNLLNQGDLIHPASPNATMELQKLIAQYPNHPLTLTMQENLSRLLEANAKLLWHQQKISEAQAYLAGLNSINETISWQDFIKRYPLREKEAGVWKAEHLDMEYYEKPIYPRKAKRAKVEGWVELEFNITKKGETSNIKVIHAEPEGVFERSAIKAIKNWKYFPIIREGQTKPQKEKATIRLTFTI